jgi:hypothetical protein
VTNAIINWHICSSFNFFPNSKGCYFFQTVIVRLLRYLVASPLLQHPHPHLSIALRNRLPGGLSQPRQKLFACVDFIPQACRHWSSVSCKSRHCHISYSKEMYHRREREREIGLKISLNDFEMLHKSRQLLSVCSTQ